MIESKVSVIVPVYNCQNHLSVSIKSILNQTHTNIELLIVDDGSTDRSLIICREFERFDNRVKVFTQENSGASVARNTGIANATGDYLMFVDADDFIEKNMIEMLVEKGNREKADFIMCGMTVDIYNFNGSLKSSRKHELKPRIILGNQKIPNDIIDLVENEKISGPCCKLIKRDLISINKIKMPAHIILQEDLYFNIKVLENVKKMVIIEGCYYHYNKGLGSSVTTRYYPNKYEMTNEVHDLLLNFYKRCEDASIVKRIEYIYIKNTYAAFINLFHKDCNLSREAKINYISNIINSSKYIKMINSASKPGLKYKILLGLLKTNRKILIYYSSKCFHYMKYFLGVGY